MRVAHARVGGLLTLSALLAACGDFRGGCPSGQVLQRSRCVVGVDAGADAGRDAGADASADAGSDAVAEAGADAGAGTDAVADAGRDAVAEASVDAGAGTDAVADAGRDAVAEASVDAGADVGADAGSDAMVDAAGDGVADAGVEGECTSNFQCGLYEYCASSACGGRGFCERRPQLCSFDIAPVCGCDGMVYTNRCEAGQRGVRVATEAGITICGSICVNLMTNPANCGACARACASDRMCVAGACVPVQRSCESSTTPGCGMVRFMGGAFTQGDSMAVAATPVMTTTVSPFAIDAYEVTVARFRQFWAARPTTAAPTTLRARGIAYRGGTIAWGEAAQDRFIDGTSCNWSATDDRASAHPMNCVDYWLAQEFCVWDGGRLPTEAEWEFAARGSAVGGLTPGRVYPWGVAEPVGSSAVSCQRAHFNSCRGDDSRLTVPVGRFPATAELFDMAGNVSEWTADTYSQYTMCGISPAAADPLCNASARVEPRRVHRGGSYSTAAIYLRAASREARQDSTGSVGIGFRCARDVSL